MIGDGRNYKDTASVVVAVDAAVSLCKKFGGKIDYRYGQN